MRSVLARFPGAVPAETPKSLAPRGFGRSGLVMADAPALAILRGERTAPAAVVVAEGEIDWLSWALLGDADATFGVAQGSWSAGIAARIPAGSRLVVALDVGADGRPDAGSERIVASIKRNRPRGAELLLWTPGGKQ
jgi:hypothetical protein